MPRTTRQAESEGKASKRVLREISSIDKKGFGRGDQRKLTFPSPGAPVKTPSIVSEKRRKKGPWRKKTVSLVRKR